MKQIWLINFIITFLIASVMLYVAVKRVEVVRVHLAGLPTLLVYEVSYWGWPATFKTSAGTIQELRTDFPLEPFLPIIDKGTVNVDKHEYDRLFPQYNLDKYIAKSGAYYSTFDEGSFHVHLFVLDIVLVVVLPTVLMLFFGMRYQKVIQRRQDEK